MGFRPGLFPVQTATGSATGANTPVARANQLSGMVTLVHGADVSAMNVGSYAVTIQDSGGVIWHALIDRLLVANFVNPIIGVGSVALIGAQPGTNNDARLVLRFNRVPSQPS